MISYGAGTRDITFIFLIIIAAFLMGSFSGYFVGLSNGVNRERIRNAEYDQKVNEQMKDMGFCEWYRHPKVAERCK